VKLALVDETDELDDEDRARLHAALDESQAEIDRGEGVPASEVIAELRSRAR
jgi:predicted transcriptional regulator